MRIRNWKRLIAVKGKRMECNSFAPFWRLVFIGLLLSISACGSMQTAVVEEATPLPLPIQTAIIDLPTPIPFPSVTNTVLPLHTQTPDYEKGDIADYYGGLVITLDYVGQTITMKPGQGFLLRLGVDFDWEVEILPAGLITMNRNITPEQGEQGVYIARKKGAATLKAIGKPICLRNDPPCLRPNVLFEIMLDIQ